MDSTQKCERMLTIFIRVKSNEMTWRDDDHAPWWEWPDCHNSLTIAQSLLKVKQKWWTTAVLLDAVATLVYNLAFVFSRFSFQLDTSFECFTSDKVLAADPSVLGGLPFGSFRGIYDDIRVEIGRPDCTPRRLQHPTTQWLFTVSSLVVPLQRLHYWWRVIAASHSHQWAWSSSRHVMHIDNIPSHFCVESMYSSDYRPTKPSCLIEYYIKKSATSITLIEDT